MADIYPPRAANRGAVARVETRLGRPGRQARKTGAEMYRREKVMVQQLRRALGNQWLGLRWWLVPANMRQALEWWWAPAASIFPGAGQCLQRRWGRAATCFALALPCCWLTYIAITNPVSLTAPPDLGLPIIIAGMLLTVVMNLLPICAAAAIWYSVWEAACHSFPATENSEVGRAMRARRLGFMSAAYVCIVLAIVYLLIRGFDAW
jgi:hypothetical protein